MYCRAIRTRLLVGIFTPAIRAKDFSPVADLQTGHVLAISGRCPQTRTRRPSPWISGRGIVQNYPTWIRALLKDSTWFRQPLLCFSPPFHDLFGGFPGSCSDASPGTRDGLSSCLFWRSGGCFCSLLRGSGAFPGCPGCLLRALSTRLAGPFGGRFATLF